MKQKAHGKPRRKQRRRDRGSALLVSLMVMVGLSLLGLSFVAISETENAISANERNKTQTAAMAEAGAKAAVQWFQDPVTLDKRNLLPDNDPDFKTLRVANAYTGFYKAGGGLLFDTPFGPRENDMFYGDEAHADVLIIDGRNAASSAFITAFNDAMFFKDPDPNPATTMRVTAIRVYAPPIVGGNLVNGFWVGGQRYGVATIAVTAEKRSGNNILSQSICRMVVAPFPLPGPSGAIQAIGGIDTNGAYEVHWGSVESEQTATNTYIKRESSSFPWFDAYDRVYFENGLDSSTLFVEAKNYKDWVADSANKIRGAIVRPTDAAIALKHEYEIIQGSGTFACATEPAWNQAPGSTTTCAGGLTFREVTPTAYPVSAGTGTPYKGYNNHVWLTELLHRSVQDPWFQVRTKGRVDGKITGLGTLNVPHPTDYATLADNDMAKADDYMNLNVSRSHYFQYQTYDNRPLYRAVRVPRFDYDFWKAAAVTGRGQKNVYYLEWVSNSNYTNGAETKTFEQWVQTSSGFFFFDTKNKMNPQKGGPGILVPIDASICGAKGVVYMNTKSIKTTGCDAVDGWYNQPGEPYRDIGYRKVNEVAGGGLNQMKGFTVDADGVFIRDKAYNNKWDYQDLPWSNNQSAKNDTFDVCMGQRRIYRQSDDKVLTEWLPLPYYPNCNVGNNFSNPSCDCSEPFEPYLNLHYAGTKENIQAYWDDPNAMVSVQPKQTLNDKPTGMPEACTGGAVSTKEGQLRCSTNAYDKRGALAMLDKTTNESAISVEGVMYNEGAYESTGNTAYYGSVVVTGLVSPQGTQEIWYDSCLADDCWPPPHIPFPRVMITSTQIQ